jgi:hypothetical protein
MGKFKLLPLISLLIFAGCATSEPAPIPNAPLNMELTSPAFTQQSTIPSKFTCDDQDISPELNWTDPPEGTESFVLIADDPDAPNGDWVHWVLYNIPADTHSIAENSSVGTEGNNSWPKLGYGGPCPPSGVHRYFFKLYALDTTLALNVGATKEDVLNLVDGHVLGQAELMGTYERKN